MGRNEPSTMGFSNVEFALLDPTPGVHNAAFTTFETKTHQDRIFHRSWAGDGTDLDIYGRICGSRLKFPVTFLIIFAWNESLRHGSNTAWIRRAPQFLHRLPWPEFCRLPRQGLVPRCSVETFCRCFALSVADSKDVFGSASQLVSG